MANPSNHTYEEIREYTIDKLLERPEGDFNQLLEVIGRAMLSKNGWWQPPPHQTGIAYPGISAFLHADDGPLILEVFWDLFRQGAVTLGHNADRPGWPYYRISRWGKDLAKQTPFRFHDVHAYVGMVKTYAPDISDGAVAYLEEAVAAFYADCLLASCVMLGVAAEAEFIRLVDVAAASPTYGAIFKPVAKPMFIRQRITKFLAAIGPIAKTLPLGATEDLDANLQAIQSVLRIARNDAGHPTAATPQREQVYVNLQLFAPLARQFMRLRQALT